MPLPPRALGAPTPAVPGRVLLIKLRHHGDILLSTPVLNALKTNFPDCRVDYLVYAETLPMLSRNRDINKVWCIDRALRGWRKPAHMLALWWRLRKQRYDWVIHLSDQFNGALIAHGLRASEVVGFDYPKRRGTRWASLFTRLAPVAQSNTMHAVEQNLLALDALDVPLGDPASHRCTMAVAQQDRNAIADVLGDLGVRGDYLVVHPSSRWFFKCWEDQRFAEVIQHLADEGWPILVSAGPAADEVALVASILSHVDSPRVHSLAGRLSLTTLAALIDGSRLFIGVDSVPMHMAAAFGKDTVALFGPSKVHEWHPWLTRHILVDAADYGPLIDPDAVDTSTGERYLKAIPTQAVLDAAHTLLDGEPGRGHA